MELASSRGPWFIHSPQPPGVGLVESHPIKIKARGPSQAICAAPSWNPCLCPHIRQLRSQACLIHLWPQSQAQDRCPLQLAGLNLYQAL